MTQPPKHRYSFEQFTAIITALFDGCTVDFEGERIPLVDYRFSQKDGIYQAETDTDFPQINYNSITGLWLNVDLYKISNSAYNLYTDYKTDKKATLYKLQCFIDSPESYGFD